MSKPFTPLPADELRFEFINVETSGKSNDTATQKAVKKLVHRHVMRETGKARRRKKNFPVLVYRSWALDRKAAGRNCSFGGETDMGFGDARNVQGGVEYSSSTSSTSDNAFSELLGSQSNLSRLASPNPVMILGGGRTDPFANYLTNMNLNTHELVGHCKDLETIFLILFKVLLGVHLLIQISASP